MWYYAIDGQQHGPVSEQELLQACADRSDAPSMLVWTPGMPAWERMSMRFPQAPAISAPVRAPRLKPFLLHLLALAGACTFGFAAQRCMPYMSWGDRPTMFLALFCASVVAAGVWGIAFTRAIVRTTPSAGHRLVAILLWATPGALVILLTLCLAPHLYKLVIHRMDAGTFTTAISAEGDTLLIDGAIAPGFSLAVDQSLQAHRAIRALVVNSPGGLTDEAEAAALAIEKRGLSVRVREYCASACVMLFMAAPQRFIEEDGWIGLHRVHLFDDLPAIFRQKDDPGDYYGFLANRGMPPAMVDKARSTPSEDMSAIDAIALAEAKLATITRNGQPVSLETAKWDRGVSMLATEKPEGALSSLLRILQVIGASRPDIVKAQAETFLSTMREDSGVDPAAVSRAMISAHTPEAIVAASDDADTSYAYVVQDITAYLQSKDEFLEACAAFSYSGESLRLPLPPELSESLLAALATVFESAQANGWSPRLRPPGSADRVKRASTRAAQAVLDAGYQLDDLSDNKRAQCAFGGALTREIVSGPGDEPGANLAALQALR